MYATAVQIHRVVPTASPTLAALLVDDRDCDLAGIAIPRPEIRIVVRFGSVTRNGLDVHAMGVRQRAHRKIIRTGQRTVTARLHLGSHEAVLGVPASALTGAPVPIEDLWSNAASRRLFDQLSDARSTLDAATILESAIAERLAIASVRRPCAKLALAAAPMLASANVNAVAVELGVSERHLRRVFREAFGVGPKAFAKLARFHRALRAARNEAHVSWAGIAACAGYYDQAHLIAEFRAIAGVTPRALLDELRAAPLIG